MGIKYKIAQLFGHILEDTFESYNALIRKSAKSSILSGRLIIGPR